VKLIRNARRVALRSYSQQAQYVALAILGAYGALPDKLQDVLPMWLVLGIACAVLVLGIVGRLVEQPGLTNDGPEKPPQP
jgi:uncharacterized membrane protein